MYNLNKFVLNILNFLESIIAVFFMITCDFFSWALNFNFNYYHRIYHMLLFFNNNIWTQSIIFLPVFSKYVLTRIRNIFEYLHKHSIMVTYFRKVKYTWTRIRKDKKRLDFRSDLICRVEVYLSRRSFAYNFKINEHFSRTVISYAHQYCYRISCLLVEYYWRYWALQLSLKHVFTEIFWTLLYFDAQYFILIG